MSDESLAFDIFAIDRASEVFKKVGDHAGEMGDRFGKVGAAMAKGLALGVTAIAGIGAAVAKAGLDDIKDSQAAAAQLAAGVKSTGGAANVTVSQMQDLAKSIQDYSGQNKDAVAHSEALLLTFTNIKNAAGANNDIFNQATKATADMAARMGTDAASSAIQLGKALNDPIQGITALTRVGVSFSDAQKKQIAAMVNSGNIMGAQKVILAELNKEFGGSAKAAGETLPGQLARAKNAFSDISGEIVEKMLPAITGVLSFINDKMLPAFSILSEAVAPAVRAGFGEVAKVFDIVKDAVQGIIGAFTGGGSDALDNFSGPTANKLIDAGGRIRALFDDLAKFWSDTVVPAGHKLATAFAGAFSMVQAAAQRVWPIVKQIVGSVVQDFQRFAPQIRQLLTQVVNIWSSEMTLIGNVVRKYVDIIVALWHRFGDNILKQVELAFQLIVGTLHNAFTVIQGVIDLAIDLLTGKWGKAWQAVEKIFGAVWDEIKLVVKYAVATIGNELDIAWKAITGVADKAWDGLKSLAKSAWGGIVDAVKSVWNGIADFFTGVFNGVLGAIKTPINAVIAFVDDVIRKINSVHIHVPHIPGTNVGGNYGFNIPEIPQLAAGGIVPATPGGRLIRVAEAGEDEAIVPLSRAGFGGGEIHVHFDGPFVGGSQSDARRFAQYIAVEMHQALISPAQRYKNRNGATGLA